MDQEQKLKSIYDGFANSLKSEAEKTLGELVSEYLPYDQTDLDMNIYMRSSDVIKNFLLDKDIVYGSEVEDKQDLFNELNSKEVRAKMLVEFKDELLNNIIADQLLEIANLKQLVKTQEETIEIYRNRNPY